MTFILDTNVLAESSKVHCSPKVAAWMATQPSDELYLSAITVGEVVRGLELLPDGPQRRRLSKWWYNVVFPAFENRILPVDAEVAERWGQVKAHAKKSGYTLHDLDGLIAATALVHGLAVATRNVRDLGRAGVMIVNPWL